jgi:glycosyltransferase involved in cell wall biosynthesis
MTLEAALQKQGRKVVFFLSSMVCGGAERVALLLSTAMVDLGCQVSLVLARREGGFLAEVSPQVEVISLDCGKPIKGLRRFGEVVRRLNPDAIVSFGVHAGIAAALSKACCGFHQPLLVRNESNVSVEWARERFHNRLLGPLLSRWMARKSTVVCVSRSLREPTAGFLRIAPELIEVVLNPVFPIAETSNTGVLHPWLVQKGGRTLVAMGRLEVQKDFDSLLRAFRRVQDQVPCRLVIFGEGTLRPSLVESCARLGLNDVVDFPGVTSSPALQMRHAAGFVLSSRWEGFGLVLVEALAAGTDVIATDCDFGPSEILDGGRYGTLVPVSDEAALAAAMVDLIKNGGCHMKPDAEWYTQFDARSAALRHIEIIEKLVAR